MRAIIRLLAISWAVMLIALIAVAGYAACANPGWWLRFRHPSYGAFLAHGGDPSPVIEECLGLDAGRDDMVRGRSADKLREIYPFLVPGEAFGPGTYRGANPGRPGGRILWFGERDGAGWCIVLEADPARNHLELVKG
jgi:hypothetical protein